MKKVCVEILRRLSLLAKCALRLQNLSNNAIIKQKNFNLYVTKTLFHSFYRCSAKNGIFQTIMNGGNVCGTLKKISHRNTTDTAV